MDVPRWSPARVAASASPSRPNCCAARRERCRSPPANPNRSEAAAAELRALGHQGQVSSLAGNAGDADARAEAVARAVTEFGSLDILINNTGINPSTVR